nr:uncharacterized protein LOC117274746 isoform X2 [Nicotiana tomentosiformis]
MYGDLFLFEFPNRYMVERTILGQWFWKKLRLQLEWWNPMAGYISNAIEIKETWIKVVGIPLHLWSQRSFQEIGEFCGGWVATEEETELKNHLKWAKILVRNNGRNLPREVSITCKGITHHIPIWPESKTRYEVSLELAEGGIREEDTVQEPGIAFTQRENKVTNCAIVQKYPSYMDFEDRKHVGGTSLTAGRYVKKNACEKQVAGFNEATKMGQQAKPNKEAAFNNSFGPDFAGQVIFNDLKSPTSQDLPNNHSYRKLGSGRG